MDEPQLHTTKAARTVQLIIALMLAGWITAAVVAALSLSGPAAAVVAVAILVGGAAAGWFLRRRALTRAAARADSALRHGHNKTST